MTTVNCFLEKGDLRPFFHLKVRAFRFEGKDTFTAIQSGEDHVLLDFLKRESTFPGFNVTGSRALVPNAAFYAFVEMCKGQIKSLFFEGTTPSLFHLKAVSKGDVFLTTIFTKSPNLIKCIVSIAEKTT